MSLFKHFPFRAHASPAPGLREHNAKAHLSQGGFSLVKALQETSTRSKVLRTAVRIPSSSLSRQLPASPPASVNPMRLARVRILSGSRERTLVDWFATILSRL